MPTTHVLGPAIDNKSLSSSTIQPNTPTSSARKNDMAPSPPSASTASTSTAAFPSTSGSTSTSPTKTTPIRTNTTRSRRESSSSVASRSFRPPAWPGVRSLARKPSIALEASVSLVVAEPELGVGEATLGSISGDTSVSDARNGSASASAALLSAVQSKSSDSVSAAELDGSSLPFRNPDLNVSASPVSSEPSTVPPPPQSQTPKPISAEQHIVPPPLSISHRSQASSTPQPPAVQAQPSSHSPPQTPSTRPSTSPSKHTWFSSLTRSKGKVLAGASTPTSTTAQTATTNDAIADPLAPQAPTVPTHGPVEVRIQPPTPAMGSEAVCSSSTSPPSTVAGPSTPLRSVTGSSPLANDFFTPTADLASTTAGAEPLSSPKFATSSPSVPSSSPNPSQSPIPTPKTRRTWFSPRGSISSSPVRGSSTLTPASPPKSASPLKPTPVPSSIPLRASPARLSPSRKPTSATSTSTPATGITTTTSASTMAVVATGVITPTPVPATSSTAPTAASQLALALSPPSETSSPAPISLVSVPSASTTSLAPKEEAVPRPATPPPGYPASAAPLVHSPTSYSSPSMSASASTSQVPTPRPNSTNAPGKEEDERPPVYVASSRTRTPVPSAPAPIETSEPQERRPEGQRLDTTCSIDDWAPSGSGAPQTQGLTTPQPLPAAQEPSSANANEPPAQEDSQPYAPPPPQLQQSPLLSPDAASGLAVLNPSASRFALALPLLGRWGVGMGSNASAGAGGSGGNGESGKEGKESAAKEGTTMGATDTTEVTTTTTTSTTTVATTGTSTNGQGGTRFEVESERKEDQESSKSPADSSALPSSRLSLPTEISKQSTSSATSWWDYVGWMSQQTAHESPLNIQTGVRAVEEIQSLEAQSREAEAAFEAEAIKDQQDAVSKAIEQITSEEGPVEQAQTYTEMATWYSPWSWYYTTASATMATSGSNSEDTPQQEHQHEEDRAEKMAVELHVPIPSNDDPLAPPGMIQHEHTAEINPVAAMIDTSKSGWASFFSSRALMMKSLGYGPTGPDARIENVKRDENGMEVMDLDSDDEAPDTHMTAEERGRGGETKDIGAEGDGTRLAAPLAIKPSSSAADNNSDANSIVSSVKSRLSVAAPLLKVSADVKKKSAKSSGGAASTPRRGNSGRSTPTPPSPSPSTASLLNGTMSTSTILTTTTTKNGTTGVTSTTTSSATTSKRTASPAPSKKPVSAPPPPNLVLPKWQDTFHTAPRNVLPPKPEIYVDDQGVGGKLLGRTMKFVNNVLFAKEGASTTGSVLAPLVGGAGAGRTKGKERERARDSSAARMHMYDGSMGVSVTEPGESLIERDRRERFREWGKELPKAWHVFEEAGYDTREMGHGAAFGGLSRSSSLTSAKTKGAGSNRVGPEAQAESKGMSDVLGGCRRVVVIGVHGWFPGAMMRTVLGEPTGTSAKFANMTEQALLEFEKEHNVKLEKITKIPLEGDGTIEKRVERLYSNLKANQEWMSDLHEADAIIVATHSQGSVVSAHLLDHLIRDNHIVTSRNQSLAQSIAQTVGTGAEVFPAAIGLSETTQSTKQRKVQRVCCLALCGIHLGPLRYLSSSTLVGPYLQYFESTAARELFEFQNTETAVSKAYVAALQNVLDHGTKVLYVASLNDQVVPIYSGLFTAVSHPLILRALYIDGDAYHSSDFLSNLLVLLLRILNSGMSDSGLLAHLSEATAGSLNGVGHSTAYEELESYSLAVKYLFLTNEGMTEQAKLSLEPFNASQEQNDYEIPWSLRDIIADERVAYFFSREISELRDAFREWHPKTTILRDLKRKLQPIQRLPSTFSTASGTSKL